MIQANRLPIMPAQGIDADVVARAEAALKSLSVQFSRWLQDEIDKLEAANGRLALEGLAGEAGETFHIHAHDLKGLGGTYEFPIVTRVAASPTPIPIITPASICAIRRPRRMLFELRAIAPPTVSFSWMPRPILF